MPTTCLRGQPSDEVDLLNCNLTMLSYGLLNHTRGHALCVRHACTLTRYLLVCLSHAGDKHEEFSFFGYARLDEAMHGYFITEQEECITWTISLKM